jgi:hypothetical protein
MQKLTMARNASNLGGLHAAEDLLTQEIDADSNNHHCYASRSVIRARKSDWDNALQDAVKVRLAAYYNAVDGRFTLSHSQLLSGPPCWATSPKASPSVATSNSGMR